MAAYGVVLIAGAALTATAWLGGRMLGPFYGLTAFLTSTLACVSLGAVALGAAVGGRSSTPDSGSARIGPALAGAALWTLAIPWIRHPLLATLEHAGLRIAVVATAAIVLGPPLFLLATTLPWAVRSKTVALERVAPEAGRVIAVFVLGAMLGVLGIGSVLFPHLGLRRCTIAVAALEMAGAGIAFASARARRRAAGAALGVLGASLLISLPASAPTSAPGRVLEVREGSAHELRVLARNDALYLLADGTLHSVIGTDSWTSLHRAGAAFEDLKLLFQAPDTLLLLGPHGGSVARSFTIDGWTVDAVEPDRAEAEVAARHFRLRPSHARMIVMDPRVFCRSEGGRYSLVVIDAYSDSPIPYHLVTAEFFDLIAGRLRPDGVLALSVEAMGWDDILIRSLAATLERRFRSVVALPTSEPPNVLGSIVLLASNRAELDFPESRMPNPSDYLADPTAHWTVVQMNHAWSNRYQPDTRGAVILTDDQNPVDQWSERINLAARGELHRFFGPRGGSW